MRIAILPIGRLDDSVASRLASELSVFGEVDILREVDIPESAYVPRRRQYLASSLLALAEPYPQDKVLGVTDVDMYEGEKRFVFGLAEIGGRSALISLRRLKGGDPTLETRSAKEALHELGHTFGLRHCPDRRCVMAFSNSLADTDFKQKGYCRSCTLRLRNSGILPR